MAEATGTREPARDATWPDRIATRIEQALDVLLGLGILAMATAIIWQVFGRYALDRAPSWSEELARYLMAWITLLGAAAVLRSGEHITVTVLVDRLPPRIRRPVLLVRDAAVLLAAGVLAWYGYDFAMLNSFQDSAAMEIPMSVPYAAVTIGAALVILVLVLARLGRSGDWTGPGDQT